VGCGLRAEGCGLRTRKWFQAKAASVAKQRVSPLASHVARVS
jgi:hypothetical protein